MSDRIQRTFAALRRRGEAAFMPFLSAGDPDLETTRDLILEVARRGADVIELGIPFSDPIADGPTIQASFTRALAGGTTVGGALDAVKSVRRSCEVPIVTMVSFSIVSRIGTAAYVHRAAEAGADGLIVPDLPVEEAGALRAQAQAEGLCTIFLVAPTTDPDRARRIAEHSTGFIYYVSVTGTTGARDRLPEDLPARLAALKALTDTPVALGFGVGRPEQAAEAGRAADGVIVGSAIVKKIQEYADASRADLVKAVGDFVESLAAATKGR